MSKSLIRLMVITAFGSVGILQALLSRNVFQSGETWSGSFVAHGILVVCVAAVASAAFYYLLKKLVPYVDASAHAQTRFLHSI